MVTFYIVYKMSNTLYFNMDGIHSKTICRTCLYESSELTPIFDVKEIEDDILTISEIIYSCTDLEVYSNDQLPQFICENCIETVVKCYLFRKRCHDSDVILRSTEIIDEAKLSDDAFHDILEEEPASDIKPTCKFENEFEEETFDLDFSEDRTFEPGENIKCESESDMPELDDVTKQENPDNTKIQIKAENSDTPGNEKYPCVKCSAKFSTKEECERHGWLYHRNLLCNVCGKEFSVKNSFHSHMRIHSRRHICNICSKSFSDIFQLKMHMNVHTGERPYKCIHCSSSYTQNAYLRIHMRTHTKEKPYKCPSCDASFISRRKLRLHEVVHDPEKYKCVICSKCFRTGESLKRHQFAHSGIRRFNCELCTLGFHTKRDLGRHIENHDKELVIDC